MVVRIAQHAVEHRAGDELERLGQRRIVGALALAAQRTDRLAEQGQEPVAVALAPAFLRAAQPGELPGARASGHAAEPWADAGHARHRIQQLLGLQRPDDGSGEVALIVLVRRRGSGRQLVGPRTHDRPNHRLEIEFVLDEVLRQGVEQFGIDGGIGVAEIIDRIDDSASQEMLPDAIDLGAGEEGIVWPGDPVRQRPEAIGFRGKGRRGRSREARRQNLIGDGMLQFAGAVEVDDLLAGELVLVELIATVVFEDAIANAGEEGGQAVVVRLRPPVEGVVVAFGTLQPQPQKHLSRGLRSGRGVSKGSIIVGSRMVIGASSASYQLVGRTR